MYTPEELLHSHQNQATFNFNNLPSHEKLFRLSVPRTLLWQAVNPNQRNSRSGPATLENKV
jgi:hypothetical protein